MTSSAAEIFETRSDGVEMPDEIAATRALKGNSARKNSIYNNCLECLKQAWISTFLEKVGIKALAGVASTGGGRIICGLGDLTCSFVVSSFVVAFRCVS